mmetsp:Transcript_10691/g.10568  ORF Transcript_10691/g.10568 Transcript_10691/m.10568 type:complete len:99 (-) Transcript_10691:94-390(-)
MERQRLRNLRILQLPILKEWEMISALSKGRRKLKEWEWGINTSTMFSEVNKMQHMTREERKEAYRLVEEDFIQNEDKFRNIKEYEPGKGINLPLSSHG